MSRNLVSLLPKVQTYILATKLRDYKWFIYFWMLNISLFMLDYDSIYEHKLPKYNIFILKATCSPRARQLCERVKKKVESKSPYWFPGIVLNLCINLWWRETEKEGWYQLIGNVNVSAGVTQRCNRSLPTLPHSLLMTFWYIPLAALQSRVYTLFTLAGNMPVQITIKLLL